MLHWTDLGPRTSEEVPTEEAAAPGRMEAVVGAAMRVHVFDGRFKTDRGMGGEMPGQVIVHIDSAQLSFCQLLASDALGGRKVVHVSRPPMPRPWPAVCMFACVSL